MHSIENFEKYYTERTNINGVSSFTDYKNGREITEKKKNAPHNMTTTTDITITYLLNRLSALLEKIWKRGRCLKLEQKAIQTFVDILTLIMQETHHDTKETHRIVCRLWTILRQYVDRLFVLQQQPQPQQQQTKRKSITDGDVNHIGNNGNSSIKRTRSRSNVTAISPNDVDNMFIIIFTHVPSSYDPSGKLSSRQQQQQIGRSESNNNFQTTTQTVSSTSVLRNINHLIHLLRNHMRLLRIFHELTEHMKYEEITDSFVKWCKELHEATCDRMKRASEILNSEAMMNSGVNRDQYISDLKEIVKSYEKLLVRERNSETKLFVDKKSRLPADAFLILSTNRNGSSSNNNNGDSSAVVTELDGEQDDENHIYSPRRVTDLQKSLIEMKQKSETLEKQNKELQEALLDESQRNNVLMSKIYHYVLLSFKLQNPTINFSLPAMVELAISEQVKEDYVYEWLCVKLNLKR